MKGFKTSQLSHKLNERKAAEREPLVRAVLDHFPGSEVVEVRSAPLDHEAELIASLGRIETERRAITIRLARLDEIEAGVRRGLNQQQARENPK